jgi:hypothetical protein
MTKSEENCRKKKVYESFESAKFFAKCDQLWAYRCPECSKYHLTKRRPRKK